MEDPLSSVKKICSSSRNETKNERNVERHLSFITAVVLLLEAVVSPQADAYCLPSGMRLLVATDILD